MVANADDIFNPDSYSTPPQAAAAAAPTSPGGTTVQNGIETVTTTATRLFDWKKAALLAFIALAIYLTWRQTRERE